MEHGSTWIHSSLIYLSAAVLAVPLARLLGLGSIIGAGRVEPRPASSYPSAPKTSTAQGLRTGQSVFHTKFGEGVILTLEGSGEDARAQVNFGRHGMKWLALSVAKLTPVN